MIESNDPPPDATPLEKRGHGTYHLAPAADWQRQQTNLCYVPERFEDEGFIHCTDSIEEVIAVGNRYYLSDPRPYVLLEIDCGSVAASIVYEDAGMQFPHIYGALELDAIRRILPVIRAEDGRFLSIGEQVG